METREASWHRDEDERGGPGATRESAAARAAAERRAIRRHGRNATDGAERLATGLGWLSIGLGVAGLLATGAVARGIGLRDRARTRTILRLLGAREIVSGLGILTRRRRSIWAWTRLGGDVMDVALLRSALAAQHGANGRGAVTTAALLGIAAVDGLTAMKLTRAEGRMHHPVYVNASITIDRSPEEIYRFWRDLRNVPRFMRHIEAIQEVGKTWRWRARLPGKLQLEWESELVDDRPGERIAWRSLPGSRVENHGFVRFVRAPGDRGTEVHLFVNYEPVGGAIGAAFARLLGAVPQEMMQGDLRRLKQLLETGDVARSDASIHFGRLHPARPSGQRLEPAMLHSGKAV